MTHRLLSLLLLAAAPLAIGAAAPVQRAATADAAFAALGQRYIGEVARMHPTFATGLGDHRYDAEVEDLSVAGRARDLAFLTDMQRRLAAIPRSSLSRDNQVDAALLANALAYQLWSLQTLKDWEWDPQGANEAISGGLYLLAARDFAPWKERLASATARMEKIPRQFEQMRASLVPARVPDVHARTVSQQNAGLMQIVDTMLAPHRGELDAAGQARFDKARAAVKAASEAQQTWLDTVLVPQAKGDFRIGPALYDRKMAFAHLTDLTRPQLKAAALKAAADTRAQMYAIAREVLADPSLPAVPSPAQQQRAIEAALERSYAKTPARDGLIAASTKATQEATAFVRARNLVRVPDTPVQIIDMPKFRQGPAVAYCDAPGRSSGNSAPSSSCRRSRPTGRTRKRRPSCASTTTI